MSKRNSLQDFELRPRDFYPTIDPAAVEPLEPFIGCKTYAEPCFGAGDLVKLLEKNLCVWSSDIKPQLPTVNKSCGTQLTKEDLEFSDLIITNPPFTRKILLPLMDHFISLKPTWLLLPADVAHNKYMSEYMKNCQKVVSVGRLYWMDNKVKGVDNFCWYFFPHGGWDGDTVFYGR